MHDIYMSIDIYVVLFPIANKLRYILTLKRGIGKTTKKPSQIRIAKKNLPVMVYSVLDGTWPSWQHTCSSSGNKPATCHSDWNCNN